jgi:hypothetical protein
VNGPEDLFALETEREENDYSKTLSRIRQLSQLEQSLSRRATALLHGVTEDSALLDLLNARDRFEAAVEALETTRGVQDIKNAGKDVQREFKAWLSAFRGFDDRTSAWLSRTFEDASPRLAAFKRLTNLEYDTNFAYRLCATLRNASEHAGDVINGMSAQSGVGDDGVHFTEVTLQFVGQDLADRFDRMKAAVRSDLRSLRQPIEVEDVMEAVRVSCQRIHYGLVAALWDELEPAVSMSTAFHEEAVAEGGDWAVFINSDFDPRRTDANLSTRYNPYNLADLVARHRREADKVLAEPPLGLEAADFSEAG